jgi:hypothetical protein
MFTEHKRQIGQTESQEKNPYMRDDFWASGYFDFLWKSGISRNYRERLDAIKSEAMHAKEKRRKLNYSSAHFRDRINK